MRAQVVGGWGTRWGRALAWGFVPWLLLSALLFSLYMLPARAQDFPPQGSGGTTGVAIAPASVVTTGNVEVGASLIANGTTSLGSNTTSLSGTGGSGGTTTLEFDSDSVGHGYFYVGSDDAAESVEFEPETATARSVGMSWEISGAPVNIGAETNANAAGELDVVHGGSGARFGVFTDNTGYLSMFDSTGSLMFEAGGDTSEHKMFGYDLEGVEQFSVDFVSGAIATSGGLSLGGGIWTVQAGTGNVTMPYRSMTGGGAIDQMGDVAQQGVLTLTDDGGAVTITLDGQGGTLGAETLYAPGGLADYAFVSGGSASFSTGSDGTLSFTTTQVAGDGNLVTVEDACTYVVPEAGLLTVEVRLGLASSTGWADNEVCTLKVVLNNTDWAVSRLEVQATNNPFTSGGAGQITLQVSAGDRVWIECNQDSGGTIIAGSSTGTWATFTLVRR